MAQPDGGVRLYMPMLDGSDRVGVLALTLPAVDDNDRRLAQRIAGLTADLVVTKSGYTDTFVRTRMGAPMSLSAHLQWQMLPPLVMTTPDVALAGALEPAYDVGGDSFDYALDEHTLHLAVFDAMGHGVEAATMATLLIAAYRHGRVNDSDLPDMYAEMDAVMADSYPGRFATALIGRLDTTTGGLSWVNAGHPPGLLIREGRVVQELTGRVSRPAGFGDGEPHVHSTTLRPHDRVLFFTDGVVEERMPDGVQFGEQRLREFIEDVALHALPVAETVRLLSHALLRGRGGPDVRRRLAADGRVVRPAAGRRAGPRPHRVLPDGHRADLTGGCQPRRSRRNQPPPYSAQSTSRGWKNSRTRRLRSVSRPKASVPSRYCATLPGKIATKNAASSAPISRSCPGSATKAAPSAISATPEPSTVRSSSTGNHVGTCARNSCRWVVRCSTPAPTMTEPSRSRAAVRVGALMAAA